MYLQSLLAAFCLLMGSYSQETDPLPVEDPKHFGDQDATKVVVLTGQHWVKMRTYNVSSKRGDPKCEYAQIVGNAE
uniref:Putative salivary lipocalin n=1 Tax=Ixodes ricinus TaxID=34613 RepID=A0A0K8R8H8_IXORI